MSLEDPVANQIADYIQKLPETKKTLPFGLPVNVLSSYLVTKSAALVQLASEIGPYIGVLTVQADIIDDWTLETADQLSYYAKKHGFILWEGSRVLNGFVNFMGRLRTDQESLNMLANITRKNYTHGALNTAKWAGLATMWAPGVPWENQDKDLMIPTLRKAAREAVATTVKTIQTEISAEGNAAEEEDSKEVQLSPPTSDGWSEFNQENIGRKSSTISVTESVTAQPHVQLDEGVAPPPLLARGVVFCLPGSLNSAFTPDYRTTTLAAACANPDFVTGLFSAEPYFAENRGHILTEIFLGDDKEKEHLRDEERRNLLAAAPHLGAVKQPLTLFSLVPPEYHAAHDEGVLQTPHEQKDSRPASVVKLFAVLERAMAAREEICKEQGPPRDYTNSPKRPVYHVPTVLLP